MKRGLVFLISLLCITFLMSNQSFAKDGGLFSNDMFKDFTGNINLNYGSKELNDYDWEDMASHTEMGANIDLGFEAWPLYFTFGYITSEYEETFTDEYSYEEAGGGMPPAMQPPDGGGGTQTVTVPYNRTIETTTKELRYGVKKIWEPTSNMRPFLGFGLSTIQAKYEETTDVDSADAEQYNVDTISNYDTSLGTWISGGVYWTFYKYVNLGVEVGYSHASVELKKLGEKLSSGGTHYGLFLGFHF